MTEPTILFEDDAVVVVNKPAGMLVHSDGVATEATLVDWLLVRYPNMNTVGEMQRLSSGETIPRPGIVHRIDRDTSGIVIVAKTQEAFLFLKHQFQTRAVHKEYRAFVYGVMGESQGTINRPIGRSASDFRLWSAQRGARGTLRDAVTHFRVLQETKEYSYISLQPETGRTHQIRVHLKAVNHPVVADPLYAPNHPQALGFTRLALHAHRITFESPHSGAVTVEAPLPVDFKEAEHAIGFEDGGENRAE